MTTERSALSPRTNAGIPAMIERAALMLDAQAGIVVLAPRDGLTDELIAGWGMTLVDARSCGDWIVSQMSSQSSDLPPIAALTIPTEHWPPSVTQLGGTNDGEAIAMALVDDHRSLGWMALFGSQGAMNRPPLDLPRTRAAFIGQVSDQARALMEARMLRDQRDQLESVFRYSGDGMLTVDAMLRVTACNPALEQLIATSSADMLGRFYYDVLRPETLQGEPLGLTHCPLVEAFATGTPVVARHIIIHARDGQAIPVAVTAASVLSPEGVPISGVLNVRDTSHERTDEQLTSTFVSVVSHELQTPIAIIKGYASTLGRPDAQWSGDALRQRLVAIEEEADRLSHMVDNLLYASRIQAGGLTMRPGPLDLGDVVTSCARRFSARGLLHTLRLHVPPNMPVVNADRERIEEVVANLLDNAAKYSPPGTPIVVTARCTSEDVVISVSDSGAGIPLREQQRVFERFRRVEGDLTRNTNGAGLGLYICQAIVRAHGGRIWVESELGRGSTFAFSLARIEPAAVPMIVITSEVSQQEKKEPENA